MRYCYNIHHEERYLYPPQIFLKFSMFLCLYHSGCLFKMANGDSNSDTMLPPNGRYGKLSVLNVLQ